MGFARPSSGTGRTRPGGASGSRRNSGITTGATTMGSRPTPSPTNMLVLPASRWDDEEARMSVTGIGGFFFRAKDPEAMRAWYVEHLGVGSAPYGSWETQAGARVFAPFAGATDTFAA